MTDGNVVKRTTLSANTEEIIQFSQGIQNLSLMAQGTIYYKVDGTITGADDTGANFLDTSAESVDIYKNKRFTTLHLFTTETSVIVQWDLA